ncbi:hypothetical protein ACWCQZ_32860 [Streptomyces sp. NPDC002285]
MTWPATLPGAALRVLRTAAGWRALQLALLVGGVLAIGLLCGERAYAADGVSAGRATSSSSGSAPSAVVGATASAPEGEETGTSAGGAVERLVSDPAAAGVCAAADPAAPELSASPQPQATSPFSPTSQPPAVSGPAPEAPAAGASASSVPAPHAPTPGAPASGDPAQGDRAPGTPPPSGQAPYGQGSVDNAATAIPHPTDDQVLRPVTERVIQGVGHRVVAPVADVVEPVTGGLAEVQAQMPPLASLPTLPALPALPTAPESPAWPSWPSRPGLEFPEFPLPELPGAGLPGFPDVPGFPAPPGQTLPAPGAETPHPVTEVPAAVGGPGDKGRTGREAVVVDYGPRFVADVAASHASTSGGARTTAPSHYAPVPQAPVDHPGGVLGNRSAGDNNSSRHGDAHAVSLNGRAPLRLVPGAAARVEADEIQDRHRDIPVSPA